MIPVQLTLHNFMAYQTPETLDFSDLHVACLTGENGAGKSALLDGITWALWGKSRTRQDDDLIHLGENEMSVEFTFLLGDNTYRVLRRRKMGKRGKTEVHLHAFIPDAGDWRTLSEGGVRGTQAKINRLLRIDYDTFINSAFLLQGRADEFTTKTAAERKEILADILGLGVYEMYEKRAADKVRFFEQEIAIALAQIEQMQQDLMAETSLRREWETSQQEALKLNKALCAAETALNDIRQRHKELDMKHRQLEDWRTRLVQSQTEIDDLSRTIARLKKNIAAFETTMSRKDEIEAGYARWQAAKKTQADFVVRLSEMSQLTREQHRLEKEIQQARTELETEQKVLQARQADLQTRIDAIPSLKEKQAALEKTVADLEDAEKTLVEYRQKITELAAESAKRTTENKQLKAEMDTIKARLTQLEDAGSMCPVCTQPLNDDHRAAVRAQFSADGKTRGDQFRANKERLDAIAAEQKMLKTAIAQTEHILRRKPAVHGELAQIAQQLAQAERAAETLVSLMASLAEISRRLADGEFAAASSAALAAVMEKQAALGYDEAAHQAADNAVASLAPFEQEWQTLQTARQRLADASAQLETEEKRYQRLLAQAAADREKVAALTEATAELPNVTKALTEADAAVTRLQREERRARDAVVAVRQQLDHLAYVAKKVGKKEAALAELRETQSLYKELRGAFGKKGVQALLIEHTIPELEEEANQILSRMTDGRVNVQFITQRTTKTNENMVETLDIRIADELGTRNYELYSGGEAFRVNFAIRIALSKLLARRAGTSLQTLVMDEGFGTQDARGRERLVEAINAIQDEFEKIIVITHIEELQSAFPTHIHVQKTDRGSRISIT